MKKFIALFMCCTAFCGAALAQHLSFQEIPSRPGVKQGFVYLQAKDVFASAVLLQGGPGAIGAAGTAERGWVRHDGFFLSGGLGRFAETGVSAAAVDVPSDRWDMNNGFRSSPEHAHDSCKHTPYEPMPAYVKAFVNSPKVDFITVEGGQDHSNACNRGHHQFLGIEQEVTLQISDWIRCLP